MNALEEQCLVADLRRRGDHRVDVASLSCSAEAYRAAARKVGREHGWRIRTFVSEDRSVVWVVWIDREQTALELRAAMLALASGRNYDDVLAQVRRENLRPLQGGESQPG